MKNSPLAEDSKFALEIDNLSFGYSPNEKILSNVSVHIELGKFIGVIGPNGGGKSTLLKLILGFLIPQSGTIRFYGKRSRPIEKLAYVPQHLHFDKQFPITTLEVVLGGRANKLSWFGRYKQEDIDYAMNALHNVGLCHLHDTPFGTLSGGQAQRVLIARALASNPSLLLLDEPTASIDSEAEIEVLNVIQSLKGSMTILMVTHDLRAALSQVDGILCVQGGALFMQPKEVCEHFALGLYHYPLLQTPPNHLTRTQTRSSLPIVSTDNIQTP